MSEGIKSFNKICGRLCVEIIGRLASPLSIGSGEQDISDGDVIFNAQGKPLLPGSSLAGALREYGSIVKGEALAAQLFGTPKDGEPGRADDRQSRVFFYDTVMEAFETGIRDGVKLNEHKTASHMGKYDRQFVERGALLRMRIEIVEREDCFQKLERLQDVWERDLQWIRLWLHGFEDGEIRLGAKSRRGFGKIRIEKARIRKFDMREKESYLEWLDWDWERPDAFEGQGCENIWIPGAESKNEDKAFHCLEIPLHIPYTLLVRTYPAAFARKGNLPDYSQLTAGGRGEQAVIPGSSWAGAFRSHIAKIVKELGSLKSWEDAQKKLDPLFGTWTSTKEKKQDLHASRIIFEETLVKGGHGLPTARIAVDRFTGGTVSGALYEGIPWAGGDTLLCMYWKKGGKELPDKAVLGMLLWAIKDLQSGILSIGGETAVGRGICEPQKGKPGIQKDKKPITEEEITECMQAAALWVSGVKNDGNMGDQ